MQETAMLQRARLMKDSDPASFLFMQLACLLTRHACLFAWYKNMLTFRSFNAVCCHDFPPRHQNIKWIVYFSIQWFFWMNFSGVAEISGHYEHFQHFGQGALHNCSLCMFPKYQVHPTTVVNSIEVFAKAHFWVWIVWINMFVSFEVHRSIVYVYSSLVDVL